jgi:hypothetical protein
MDKVRLQHHHITSQLEYEYVLGPIKIKDGLFMGDELAAKVLHSPFRTLSSFCRIKSAT